MPEHLVAAARAYAAAEVTASRAAWEAEQAELQHQVAELVTDNERLAAEGEERQEAMTALLAERATLQGRLAQLDSELAMVRGEGAAQRDAAEGVRIELARAKCSWKPSHGSSLNWRRCARCMSENAKDG